MIAIIDYNAGNITSVKNAVDRLGYTCKITNSHEDILSAEKVIFPGVGHAHSAMDLLIDKGLDKVLKSLLQPTLGICLGLQLMCKNTEEGNEKEGVECLGIFDAEVKRFPPTDIVPHMGWNTITFSNSSSLGNIPNESASLHNTSQLFRGFSEEDSLYFIHSYYASICNNTIATCNYIIPFSAALQKDNFYAAQFHPEKSGDVGEMILKNFLEL
ncbi:MAG TPA: imidazole glycerol phosphate synthase subunit HisH [Marinilabiliaceae bacterium]|nr:imidazole glycerol phosphate synthase subunit HisH [Marinilabiliaceae bacterium]